MCIRDSRYAKTKVEIEVLLAYSELQIRVKDDGVGFTADKQKATELFYQQNMKDSLKHSGMGMYISRLYCEKHGGQLLIENEKQNGAVITCLLYTSSDEGYGKNDYIETSRPLVIITAPGPGSGKMATCLSQLYHEHKRGVRAGYAKFETFPIWNIPLKHPVNLAYEAATADLNDVNMIDPFHLEAYGITTCLLYTSRCV